MKAAQTIADQVLAPDAARNDKESRFSTEAVAALGRSGLLGLTVPAVAKGAGLGPRAFAEVTATIAQTDASVAMVYMMHVAATQVIAAGTGAGARTVLADIATGEHLSTLAFSEKGSRSHFWAPVSHAERAGNGVRITAQKSWVTSAGHANSYVVATLHPASKTPTDSTLYLVPGDAAGLKVAAPWDGMGLRANASSPMMLEAVEVPDERRLTDDGGGFKAMLEVVLPWFNLGQAAVALGLCRAAVAATIQHLKASRFEHLNNVSLGEALPNLRATLAVMQIDTDGLAARVRRPVYAHGDTWTAHRASRARGQGRRQRGRHPRHQPCHARLRRRGVLEDHGHRALLPRCSCRRGHGAHRRRPARLHRQGPPGHPAFLRRPGYAMITVGAVAYDPKVVTIWEGLRSYFRDEAKLPVEVVLYLSYEAQVDALLAGAHRHRVEHQPRLRAVRALERGQGDAARDARHGPRVGVEDRRPRGGTRPLAG